MKAIWIIAKNTFREIIRDRILYGLIVFALLLISLALVLGQLSFTEQTRVSIDFGFTAMHLSAVVLAIFLGSTLVGKEIDKKTILTLLARPISRLQFLLGKCLGLVLMIVTLTSGLGAILCIVSMGMGMDPDLSLLAGMYGVILESLILLGMTIFFSSFSKPIMVVVFSIGFFLIGHWMDSLAFFSSRSQDKAFEAFSEVVIAVLPNLEHFNWRSLFIYGDAVPVNTLLLATVSSLAWFSLTILGAALVIRRRDFV